MRHSLQSGWVLISISLVVFSYPICLTDLKVAKHTISIAMSLRRQPAVIPPNFMQFSSTHFRNALTQTHPFGTGLISKQVGHKYRQENKEIINGTEIWTGMVTYTVTSSRYHLQQTELNPDTKEREGKVTAQGRVWTPTPQSRFSALILCQVLSRNREWEKKNSWIKLVWFCCRYEEQYFVRTSVSKKEIVSFLLECSVDHSLSSMSALRPLSIIIILILILIIIVTCFYWRLWFL